MRRGRWTEAQRAEMICPVSHNSEMGPEIKPPAEEPPDKSPCLIHLYKWQNFTPMRLKVNGGSKQKDKKGAEEQHVQKRRERFSSIFEAGSCGEDMF